MAINPINNGEALSSVRTKLNQAISGVNTLETDVGTLQTDVDNLETDKVNKSGDTMTGALALPANGLTVGTDQIVATGGSVGIGTSAPATLLHLSTASLSANIFRVSNETQSLNLGVNNGSGGSYVFESSNQALRFGTNNTERMRIDSAGRVTMPYQPAFLAGAVVSDTNYSAGTTIPWPRVFTNRGNHFSTSTNRFTAPVTGAYFFAFTIWHNTSNVVRVGIRINGSLVGGSSYIHARGGLNATDDTAGLHATLSLNANDWVDVFVQAGTARMFYALTFTGFLIG